MVLFILWFFLEMGMVMKAQKILIIRQEFEVCFKKLDRKLKLILENSKLVTSIKMKLLYRS